MTHQQTITIPEMDLEERLDHTLARLLPDYSRTQIKTWIDEGAILLNGKPVKGKTKVKGGELITINATLKPQPAWEAQQIPLTIIHEDDSVIVINKPVGLIVHPGAGNPDKTLLNALLHHAPELQSLPRAGILHRLDKDTSGLLVVAKTAQAFKDLTNQLKKRTILREYKAVVFGSMISGSTVDAPMGRHSIQRKKMAVVHSGRPAVTHYRIAEKFRHHTLLNVKLETGRTHQIRVHMAHIQHAIVGDTVYGGRIQLSKNMSPELIQMLRTFKRQALHAYSLGFEHPETSEFVHWEAEMPEDMQALVALLREDTRINKE